MTMKVKESERFDIQISNICFQIEDNKTKQTKVILDSIHGKAESGKILAVMGSTGCGKTTLLNAIGGRLLVTKGTILYGNYVWSKSLKRRIGFVEQDDITISSLTVRESLQYSARLRLPSTLTIEEKMARVEQVITILKLEKCSNTLIGDAMFRGISGGERKRMSIGTELLTHPSVLLLDEPTSGLDSTNALTVINCIRELAEEKFVTVVLSLHQPNSAIFSLFHDLMLLDNGKVIYHGECDKALPYFENMGFDCPLGYNIPDYLMDLLVLNKLTDKMKKQIENDFTIIPKEEDNKDLERLKTNEKLEESTSDRYHASHYDQIKVLLERTYKTKKSTITDLNTMLLYVGHALLSCVLWFRIGKTENDIYPRASCCLWLVGTWMFFPIIFAVPTVAQEESLLRKELSVGAYRLSAWFIAQSLISLLLMIVWPQFWIPFVFFVTGVHDAFVSFILTYLIIMLSLTSMNSFGIWIGALVPPSKSFTVAVLFVTYFFSYAGLFNPDMMEGLLFLRYMDVLNYSYQLALNSVFTGLSFECSPENSQYTVCNGTNKIITDRDILDQIAEIPIWVSLIVLIAFQIFCRYSAYKWMRYKYLSTEDQLGEI